MNPSDGIWAVLAYLRYLSVHKCLGAPIPWVFHPTETLSWREAGTGQIVSPRGAAGAGLWSGDSSREPLGTPLGEGDPADLPASNRVSASAQGVTLPLSLFFLVGKKE